MEGCNEKSLIFVTWEHQNHILNKLFLFHFAKNIFFSSGIIMLFFGQIFCTFNLIGKG